VSSTECNMDCNSAAKGEKCGGNYRISVYNYTCSGSPVPAPEPAPAPPHLNNPCRDASSTFSKMPWCDASLPQETRVKDMISRMTLQEKISTLDTSSPAIDSLGLVAYNWWSEATHGISHVANDAAHGTQYESNFAFPITTAMSFNRSLWHTTGQQIGKEARAFMNQGDAWSTYWPPVINLAREPRWGRNIETPGEDPYLSGEYATAFVKGFEQNPVDPGHLQASACCKHYAANSMDGSTVAGVHWDRNHFDANITMQDLVDSYLLPFQACVEKGEVSGLMCSYNAINGVPSCANDWLLDTVARKSWGFNGYITSDCDADSDVYNSHHYTSTPEEAVRDVLRAGTDVDCTSFVGRYAQSALDKKIITEEDLNARLDNLFKVRMRLNHFDPVGPLDGITTDVVCSDDAVTIARDGTVQGSTLLLNRDAALPLDVSKLDKVAVMGPNANTSKSVAGYYGGNTCGNNYWTTTDAVKAYAPGAIYLEAVQHGSNDTSQLSEAERLAAEADAVVLVLGTDLGWAREGRDATSISVPDTQMQLIESATKAATGPVIVVMMTATPLDISAILANPKVGAVLHVGMPSVQTLGIGDILFGKSAPAGRTVQTIYPASYADQISIFDFNMRPGPSVWPRPDCKDTSSCPLGTNPGRTHRFYTGQPVVPFGYGLSYTTWSYELLDAPSTVSLNKLRELLASSEDGHLNMKDVAAAGPAVAYSVKVTNTGDVDSDHTVLGLMKPPGAGVNGVPLQTLFGFERVHVKAKESATVYIYPELSNFVHVGLQGEKTPLSGEYHISFGIKETANKGMGYAEVKLAAS